MAHKMPDQEREELVSKVLESLTPAEKQILEMRFGLKPDPDRLQDAVRPVKETQKRVREIEAKALRRVRKPKNPRRIESI